MPTFLVIAALSLQAATASGQALDDSFRSDIEKVLEVTGAAQIATQTASLISRQLLETVRNTNPSISDRSLEVVNQVLESEFAKAFAGPDSLINKMVLIYAKHFTHEDVRGLLAFYGSDLGKKTIAAMPLLLQEGAEAGREWGARQMPRIMGVVMERLKAEGLLK